MKNYNQPPEASVPVDLDQTLRQHGYSDRATEESRLSAAEARKALHDEASGVTPRPAKPRSSGNSFAAFEADAVDGIKQTQDDRYNAMGEDHMGLRLSKELSAEKATVLNDQAQIEIWGSEGREVTVDGVTYTADNPYPGRLATMLSETAKSPKARQELTEKANKYEADILALVENGYELTQAKLIMDLRDNDVASKEHMIKERIKTGISREEATAQADEVYAKKSAKREQLIKDMAILDEGEYELSFTKADGSTQPSITATRSDAVSRASKQSAKDNKNTSSLGDQESRIKNTATADLINQKSAAKRRVEEILKDPGHSNKDLEEAQIEVALTNMELLDRKEAGEDIDLSVGDNNESTRFDIASDAEAAGEGGEVTSQQLLDNQEKLRQLKVAEARAKVEPEQAEQAAAQLESDGSEESGPAFEAGKPVEERFGYKARQMGRKVLNFLGLYAPNKPASTEDNAHAPHVGGQQRLTETYGTYGEAAPNNSEAPVGDSETEKTKEKLAIGSYIERGFDKQTRINPQYGKYEKDDPNGDAIFFEKRTSLMALSDGAGGEGKKGSDSEVSDIIVDAFKDISTKSKTPEESLALLRKGVDLANTRVGEAKERTGGAVATLVAAQVVGDTLSYVGIGDSLILVKRGDKMIDLMLEQGVANKINNYIGGQQRESTMISDEDVVAINNGDINEEQFKSRKAELVFGGDVYGQFKLESGDEVLLVSDGILGDRGADIVSRDEIVQALRTARSSYEAAKLLGGLSRKIDDTSVIVAKFKG